ncbi:hypothetical protein AVEN_103855-1, partial [Araneus ventricosus]
MTKERKRYIWPLQSISESFI